MFHFDPNDDLCPEHLKVNYKRGTYNVGSANNATNKPEKIQNTKQVTATSA